MTELTERLGDAPAVMLGTPSMGNGGDSCLDLLTRGDPASTCVLWVSFTRSPAACLDHWRSRHGTEPAEFGVISVGDAPGRTGTAVDPATVETVANASDLTGIGIAVNEFVADRDEPLTVCFDSLTTLLQYVDLETAYEFLHALTGQLYSVGARSHFHIDPDAHDEQTVHTLLSLFDAEVDLSGPEPSVRTRHAVGDD